MTSGMRAIQRSLEIVVDDESAPEHPQLWEGPPHEHPSSRPPPSRPSPPIVHATLRMPVPVLRPRTTLRMPAPMPRTTVKLARPDLASTAALRVLPRFLAAHAHAQAQAVGHHHVPREVPRPLPPEAVVPIVEVQPAPPPQRVAPPPVSQSFWCSLDPRLVMLSDPDSARSASFRILRDGILAKGLPRVLAVSSAAQHDGKTTCATNLALALAEHTAARLLLVDANFFSPALAEMFSIDEYTPPQPSPHLPWVAPFKLTALTPCLDVATIVLHRGEPLPRVDQRKLTRILESFFRAGYDHVILDAPALEGSPAVTQLLGVADGVLLAVRSGSTTTRALRRAVDQLGPSKTLGIALMDAPPC